MSSIETISIKGKPFESCPLCGSPLKFKYRSAPHTFQTLEGKKRAFKCIYACENEHRFSSKNSHVFPGKKYGMDVFALVNSWRYEKKMTLDEIREELETIHGLDIAKETIRNMILMYHVLSHEYISSEKIAKMKKHGGVVLSIDALDPTKGADPLYVVRDDLTDTVLAARFIYSASEDVLTGFFTELKEQLDSLEIPVQGIITDKHRGQENAIETVFSQVPHQLCTYHFLKNAAEPGIKWDMHLATQLRKEIHHNFYVKEFKKKDSRT